MINFYTYLGSTPSSIQPDPSSPKKDIQTLAEQGFEPCPAQPDPSSIQPDPSSPKKGTETLAEQGFEPCPAQIDTGYVFLNLNTPIGSINLKIKKIH